MENPVSGNSSHANRRPTRDRPPPVDHGDLDMRIARDGTWFYRGTPINRLPLVKLFATVLRRDPDGGYSLVTPVERGRVTVEDAPFIAVEVERRGEGRGQELIFRTNLDEIVTAGPDHPVRVETSANGEPMPYLLVRPGLEARLGRPVFYELVDYADAAREAGDPEFGVWSGGIFFSLGDPGDE
jgi:hypothetical protein